LNLKTAVESADDTDFEACINRNDAEDFNAKTQRDKGAKDLNLFATRVGTHRLVRTGRCPPNSGFYHGHFASWHLCAFALNSACMDSDKSRFTFRVNQNLPLTHE
jgi:hypothetical protein